MELLQLFPNILSDPLPSLAARTHVLSWKLINYVFIMALHSSASSLIKQLAAAFNVVRPKGSRSLSYYLGYGLRGRIIGFWEKGRTDCAFKASRILIG